MENHYLSTAMEAARQAGGLLVQLWRNSLHLRPKGPRDIVTEADTGAEQIIIQTILSRYPEHGILAEESEPAGQQGMGDYQWLIDPLDGTVNYARGIPYFCVSIALALAGRPLVGVVYEPLRDQMYYAVRGRGAFRDSHRLKTSRRDQPADGVIAFDWPRDNAYRSRVAQFVSQIHHQVGGMRSLGSAALEICAVAEGCTEAYIHPSLYPWDMGAAGLILEEAGGRLTGLDGSPEWWRGSSCLATNGLMHDALLEIARHSPLGELS